MDKTTAHLPGIRDDPPSSPDTDVEYALKRLDRFGFGEPKKHMRLGKTRPLYTQEVTGSSPVPPISVSAVRSKR